MVAGRQKRNAGRYSKRTGFDWKSQRAFMRREKLGTFCRGVFGWCDCRIFALAYEPMAEYGSEAIEKANVRY
jgi:hypothetical protein